MNANRGAAAQAAAGSGGTPPALAVAGICKTYGVVQALRPAALELTKGEVHALVGENGSGKSTLVGIVSGAVKPDAGAVAIDGTTLNRHTPGESQRHGALTVFQDGSLFPELSVAQNLYLGTPPEQRPGYREVEDWAAERLAGGGLQRLDPSSRVERLSPGDRQLLEIVRAYEARPAVLLLDEATSALDPDGVDRALDLMRKAAARGSAVLFVTHRLSEVFRVAERISVLRDGAWEGTFAAETVDSQRLVELMAGAAVDVEFPPRATPEEVGRVVLSARGLRGPRFGPVDLDLRAGEIVGVAGADDNGQLELLRGLAAVDVPDGQLSVDGRSIVSYAAAVDAGAVMLSGDRRNESLFQPLAIRENLAVGMLGKLGRFGFVSASGERQLVSGAIDRFGIKLGSPEHPISSLSGGNQQKVALARVLETKPEVVLIDEPTQGVDVRSRMDIYRMLRAGARAGLAVMLLSSDASELAGLCDRIVVVSRGAVVAELPGADATEERVVAAFAATEGDAGVPRPERAAAPTSAADNPPRRRAWAPLADFWRQHENASRLLLLVALLALLGAYAQSKNDTFLTTPSIYNILLVCVPLAAVAAAQFLVMYVGGIDVSVGATMGVTVAVLSFLVQDSSFLVGLLIALALALGIGIVIGAVNALLIEGTEISPVIATIATLGILQGIGLALRPTAAGLISLDLGEALTSKIWFLPWPLVVLAAFFLLGDWALRSTGHGLRLRSVGLNAQFAHMVGVPTTRLRCAAYVVCAVFAAIGGVLLSGQVGVGDSTVGNGYTLLAVAAPVLGGASLLGGHGTFVGCLLGAVLLVLAQSLATILGVNEAISYLLVGGLTLLALLLNTAGVGSALRTGLRSVRRRGALAGGG